MKRKLQIAIPIFDKITMLDAIGPYEVLQVLPNAEVIFVSHKPGPYADRLGALSMNATASFEDVPHPDIIVVPGGHGVRLLLNDAPLLKWLQKVHEGTMYTTSVCTGSLLLGAAGLLKGVKATTHWGSMAELAKYGATPSDDRVIQEGKIITSGGVSSGIDMALTLSALLVDEKWAKTVQLYIEYDPQPPFDTGSIAKAGPAITENARLLMQSLRSQSSSS